MKYNRQRIPTLILMMSVTSSTLILFGAEADPLAVCPSAALFASKEKGCSEKRTSTTSRAIGARVGYLSPPISPELAREADQSLDVTYYSNREEFFEQNFAGLSSPDKILQFVSASLPSDALLRMTKNSSTGGHIAYVGCYKGMNDIEIRVEKDFMTSGRKQDSILSHNHYTTTLSDLKAYTHAYIYLFPTCLESPEKKRSQEEAFAVIRFSYLTSQASHAVMEILFIRSQLLGDQSRISGNDVMSDWCLPLIHQLNPSYVLLHDDSHHPELMLNNAIKSPLRFRFLFPLMGKKTWYEKFGFEVSEIASRKKSGGKGARHIQLSGLYRAARDHLSSIPLRLVLDIGKKIHPTEQDAISIKLKELVRRSGLLAAEDLEADWCNLHTADVLRSLYHKIRHL